MVVVAEGMVWFEKFRKSETPTKNSEGQARAQRI
jgi:hypothetical protein